MDSRPRRPQKRKALAGRYCQLLLGYGATGGCLCNKTHGLPSDRRPRREAIPAAPHARPGSPIAKRRGKRWAPAAGGCIQGRLERPCCSATKGPRNDCPPPGARRLDRWSHQEMGMGGAGGEEEEEQEGGVGDGAEVERAGPPLEIVSAKRGLLFFSFLAFVAFMFSNLCSCCLTIGRVTAGLHMVLRKNAGWRKGGKNQQLP